MKEAVTKVIDALTREDFHGAFQKFFERYNKCIAAGGSLKHTISQWGSYPTTENIVSMF